MNIELKDNINIDLQTDKLNEVEVTQFNLSKELNLDEFIYIVFFCHK